MAQIGTQVAQQHDTAAVCPECAAPLQGTYCHLCGARPVDHHEYTLRHFFSHLLDEVSHFDSKIFYTLRVMVTRPGQLVADYLVGRRKRYVPPLRLFLIVFALHFFLYTAFKTTALYDISFVARSTRTFSLSSARPGAFDELLDRVAKKRHVTRDAVQEQINERWHKGANLLQFLDVFAFAICLSVLFYTRHRYFVEHLIFALNIATFMFGLSILTWPYYLWAGGIAPRAPAFLVSFVLISTYLFFAARRVYGGRTGPMLVRTLFMFIAIELSRAFFIMVTFMIAFFSVIPR